MSESADPIRKYSNAISELDKANSKVLAIGRIIKDVADAINTKPYKFIVSNINVGFPAEVSLARGIPTLDARIWPTAQQIAEAISNLHQKRREVEHLWNSLSAHDQNIVNAPPSK